MEVITSTFDQQCGIHAVVSTFNRVIQQCEKGCVCSIERRALGCQEGAVNSRSSKQ